MARARRIEIPDLTQHVVQRGNNRQPTFLDRNDFEFYLECLANAALDHACEVHAYALMTNHVHLLVTPRRPKAVSLLMQSIGRRYVRRFNRRHDRTGTLWEGRHRPSLVDGEGYLFNCYRYIEENPVRAGIVQDPGQYQWSSHGRNALGVADALIVDHPAYTGLGRTNEGRCASYRQMFKDALDPTTLERMRSAIMACRPLGSVEFQRKMEMALNRRLRPGRRGRPQKNPDPTPILIGARGGEMLF